MEGERRVTEGSAEDLTIYLAFGLHYLHQNNLTKAAHIYQQCIQKNPNDFRGTLGESNFSRL